MGITTTFSEPYFTGIAAAPDPSTAAFPIYLGGHGYILDLQHELLYAVRMKHESIPLTANQININPGPGENTINQEDLWRRTQESWHLGAGQAYADREDSIPFRFNSSQGIDCWTRWQLSLLKATSLATASANSNLFMAVAGTFLYFTDGQVLRYTTNLTAYTAVTGHPAVTASSIASDGNNVWVAYGASGIYATTRGTASQASYATGDVSIVRYVKGRLMAFFGPNVYNVIAAGALPTALFTQANTDFVWVDAAEGPDFIYMAGFSGDKSLIYKTAVKTDGTALDAPSVAGELPDGEVVRAIQGYLGFLLIGTDKGLRVGQMAASGAVTIGPLIPAAANAVTAFEPQERFVWYALSNYSGTSTGLGRVDLSVEVAPGQPAYASDLMATAQGEIKSIVTFNDERVFSVAASGLWKEAATYVTDGMLDTGLIGYGISEDKTAIQVTTESASLPAGTSYDLALSPNSGPFVDLGIVDQTGSTITTLAAGEVKARRFEIRISLNGGTSSPTFYRMTLFSDPTAALNQLLFIPILLHENIMLPSGVEMSLDPIAELAFIKSLRASRTIVGYSEGVTSYTGVVKDFTWYPYSMTRQGEGFNGTCYVEYKTLP